MSERKTCRRGIGRTAPVFLVHEAYHQLGCTLGRTPLNRQHRLRLFGIGRCNWASGLASLSEIAAGAFAQQLFGLPFHPKVLDLLLLQDQEP